MERQYRLMYRLGLTPWDRTAEPDELVRLIDGPEALSPGVALDVGCGTGRQAAFLAERGWQVTGFDISTLAIEQARARSTGVHWQVAGIADASLERVVEPLAGRVTLILDLGCLHGLDEAGRRSWGAMVARVAAPDAHLLLLAAPPRKVRSITPPGIGPDQVSTLLGPRWARSGSDSSG